MKKVITYGTFDHLHEGHMNILKKAKDLGDYLMVGVTTNAFDAARGKINVQQSLAERMEAVKATGLVDEVFPEEYEGQKIDDIKRFNVDIFVVGSDWMGKFDYLKEFCEVIYLSRTKGISSTKLRSEKELRLGIIGTDPAIMKMCRESMFVDGIVVRGIYCDEEPLFSFANELIRYSSYQEMLEDVDAVYVASRVSKRYEDIKKAVEYKKHVISESPISLELKEVETLFTLAKENKVVLFDSIKTAYSLPFSRLVLLVKTGIIGNIKAIDVTSTSLEYIDWIKKTKYYSSFTGWGSIALLPILKILGTNYKKLDYFTLDSQDMKDIYTKVNIEYGDALATLNVGIGVKSEGDLRISGTNGYIYVPSPWWKSEYFEVRFEDPKDNKPHYYNNEGEGLRMELVHFVRCANNKEDNFYVEKEISIEIVKVMEGFIKKE